MPTNMTTYLEARAEQEDRPHVDRDNLFLHASNSCIRSLATSIATIHHRSGSRELRRQLESHLGFAARDVRRGSPINHAGSRVVDVWACHQCLELLRLLT